MLVENNSRIQVTGTAYEVKVRGASRGSYTSRRLAEMAIYNLSPEDRILAEVVLLEANTGKQVLFE